MTVVEGGIMEIAPGEERVTEEEQFERKFLDVAVRIATEELRMSKKEFANLSLGRDRDHPARALQAMLGSTRTGKPQRLTLAEAVKMAKVINLQFPVLCFLVEAEIMKDKRS